jgi:hypothetical protein
MDLATHVMLWRTDPRHEARRRAENAWLAVARRLPRPLVYWAFVRLLAEGYNGNPAERSVPEAMRSWREHRAG